MSEPLTRAQVEALCERIHKEITWKHEINYILETDASLRALLRQREEEIDKLNGELHDKDVVPRSRYDACNKDWLEAEQKVREVGGAAIKEIELLRVQLAAVTGK
jgi:hypothetical protein